MSEQAHLADLITHLRFPSISTDSRHTGDVRACADWLVGKFQAMGLATTLHETPGHPVVVAKNAHQPGRPTVLIYGHYDVQPVDPLDLWHSPPFEPRIEGRRIYARGSTDNKGQHLAHMLGVQEMLARAGSLPLNVTFLIEGEEEIGSPNLAPFLRAHRADLACDIIAISDSGMVAENHPTLTYGLRGIMCCEVRLTGPVRDLHSGVFGGAVANPATEIARLISKLHDEQGHVQVDHFYDDVRPLQGWEREAWSGLPGGAEETLSLTGSPCLHGEAGFTDTERRWARPTGEINGIGGGYQGEGSKTVIPSKSFAKFSFRLVPDQDPEKIEANVRSFFERHCPGTVSLEFVPGHSGQAYVMDPMSKFGLAAQRALQTTFNAKPALIREGGSIPIVHDFKQILGADTLLLGLALPDCQIHSPNENFSLDIFNAGIRLNQRLLEELAGV